MDTNKKIGNIWESQNRSNNYIGSNNMYSLKNNKNDINKKQKFKVRINNYQKIYILIKI